MRYTRNGSGRAKRDNWLMGDWIGSWGNRFFFMSAEEVGAYVRFAHFAFWDADTFNENPNPVGSVPEMGGYFRLFGMPSEEELKRVCRNFDSLFERRDGRIWCKWVEEEEESQPRNVKATIPPEIRWQVWERDNFTCRKCGARKRLSVDHIHPESAGGTLDLDNLQTLCKSCNSRKGARVEVSVE